MGVKYEGENEARMQTGTTHEGGEPLQGFSREEASQIFLS